jgi:hypothetical protein
MDLGQCRAELRQLSVELVRAQNELAVAKRSGSDFEAAMLGYRVQAIVQRRSVFKTRVQSFRDADPSAILAEAIRQCAPDDMQRAIFKRAKEIDKEKFGEGD